MKVQELFEGAKAKKEQTVFNGFKLYIEDAYGHGLDPSAVEVGEILPTKEGHEAEYLGITADGKKVTVKLNGKQVDISPAKIMGAIHPADKKPGGTGWAKASISDHYKNK